jgi:hypothetical protein
MRKLNEGEVRRLRAQLKSLDAKRRKFLEAFYADALPADMLKSELFECFRAHPDEHIEGELREEVRLLTDARTPRRLRADCRRPVSLGRGWNKTYSAGLMRRYSNPEVKDRLDRLGFGRA